jgi:DNA-binding CsgD family transcriptional regulator
MADIGPDTDQLLALVGDIYESALDPSVTPRVLRNLAQCLNGGAAQLYSWHQSTGQVIDSQVSDELQAKDNDAFVAYYAKIDPRRAKIMERPPDTVARCHEYFDEKFVSRSEYYQDFFIPAGLRWCIGVHMNGGDGTSTLVANFRALGTPAYEDWTAQTLRRLVPHLKRAAYLKARMEFESPQSLDAQTILRSLPIAALLVDDRGRLLESNLASGEVLRDLGTSFSHGVVRLADPESDAAWRHTTQCVARTRVAATAELPGSAAGSWKAHFLPCGLLSRSRDAAERRLLLVVFELAHRSVQARAEKLRPRFGLTSAETEVLALLLQGVAPKHIASRRGASVTTVRSQMSSIFGKTSCRSQRELIAALGIL